MRRGCLLKYSISLIHPPTHLVPQDVYMQITTPTTLWKDCSFAEHVLWVASSTLTTRWIHNEKVPMQVEEGRGCCSKGAYFQELSLLKGNGYSLLDA